MDALTAIKSRTSTRNFRSDDVPTAVLEEIVDCGRLAPSGYNDQPWVFVVVTDRVLRESMAEKTTYGKFLAEAGACIAVFCHRRGRTVIEDACAATENMIIAAQYFGLGTCWVNSHRQEHSSFIETLLKCPEEYELVVLLAVGVPADTRRAKKKALGDVLRWNTFGSASNSDLDARS